MLSKAVFEAVSELKPKGAGLLLQPTGLEILQKLDLKINAEKFGAKIDSLCGTTLSGWKVLALKYKDLMPNFYGLGVHRATLFELLYSQFKNCNIDLQTNTPITAYNQAGQKVELYNKKEKVISCDLLIVANGARSSLRHLSPYFQSDHEYPWGAVWSITPINKSIKQNVLEQKYKSAHTMLGLLATGTLPNSNESLVSLFSSLPTKKFKDIEQFDLEQWKKACVRQWPITEEVLDHIRSKEQIAFATYRDVKMKQFNHGQVVFIGDAAHGMSPQLGQGANMALIDAYYLSQLVRERSTLDNDLVRYNDLRKYHLNYYQFMSRWLTPFYQSHSKFLGGVKDLLSYPMSKVPFIKGQMLKTLTGHARYNGNSF